VVYGNKIEILNLFFIFIHISFVLNSSLYTTLQYIL